MRFEKRGEEYVSNSKQSKEEGKTMKRIFCIVLIGLAVSFFGISGSNAAFIEDGAGCVLAAQDSGLPVLLVTTEVQTGVHVAETPSGNINAVCHFDIPEGFEPETAIINSGFRCVLFTPPNTVIAATDSFSLVTPGGQALLRCQYRE